MGDSWNSACRIWKKQAQNFLERISLRVQVVNISRVGSSSFTSAWRWRHIQSSKNCGSVILTSWAISTLLVTPTVYQFHVPSMYFTEDYNVQNIHAVFRRVREIEKATVGFVMSAHVRMEQLDFQWTDFLGIWYLSIFRKSAGKIQVSSKPDKNNNRHCTCSRPIYTFDHISLSSSQNEKCFRQKL